VTTEQTAFERTVRRSRYECGGERDFGRPFSIGYSLRATFAPNWMDYPLLYRDSPLPIEENMVFFMHMTWRDGGTSPYVVEARAARRPGRQ